jgi:hypothetical protein
MLLLTLRGIRNIRVNGSDAHLRPRGLRVQVSTDGPVTVRIQLGGDLRGWEITPSMVDSGCAGPKHISRRNLPAPLTPSPRQA